MESETEQEINELLEEYGIGLPYSKIKPIGLNSAYIQEEDDK